MSVTVAYVSQITVQETLVNAPAIPSPVVSHTLYNTSADLTASTTVPVTQVANFSQALSTGAATINLRTLSGTNNEAIDGNGLKVQLAKFGNPSTNANAITVTFGASNGYLLGGAAWKFILQPGMEITVYGCDATPDIDDSHKTIDLAGTGSQALRVSLILG